MKKTPRLLTITLVAMLAGCAGVELEKAERQSPVGSAFRELRQICPDVNVLIMSGYDRLDVADGFASGERVAFIQKPYGPAELATKLRDVLHA